MSTLSLDAVSCTYPDAARPALNDLNITVGDGEFLVLVGPSGCGKSTTLRILAGLEDATSGTVRIDGHDVTDVSPRERDIAMVFQNYALYPHMTVAENMEFSLKLSKMSKDERRRKVRDTAELLGLGDLLDRKPKALSGGQRQRVAMGRAVVREPKAFLMDEPLSNLDARLRVQMRAEVSRLSRQLGVTTVYVTHDQTEAMTMGDRVAVLRDGNLQQVAAPGELYDRPANVFVAGFIGSPAMSFFTVPVSSPGVLFLGQLVLPLSGMTRAGEAVPPRVTVGLRPEDVTVCSQGEQADLQLTVTAVEVLGSDAYIYGTVKLDAVAGPEKLVVRVDGRSHPQVGETVPVRIDSSRIHLFDGDSGVRINGAVS
ncbi:ABC transporter ATP-binding protein [Corynebacterium provencense]|jgi:multiple sugar transport system ATP-binding protein|uniref:Trehalose import ATP-binding protein SugC n=1 Tax=Corynebacterium provencense TaxID=1737425 RepID=A0A2Z3YM30_9CORY|nr:sn-glycerol-3-phosphate ABC transporter ATP-binding protein UgpC [Corynebacterium provencense]AWT24886.1 Trehalose import ATP-binding protein SugC [Corynebacterium provencense]MCI1255873.1 sn-glycerol-3-phosphate ABC transporter ATP-binding protein UgpC [Corynebacterium provencense]